MLLFLQQIRDEAHRFAIGFYRRRHRQTAVHSALDNIKGVGERRKKALLTRFGSLGGIQRASIEEIGALPGLHLQLAREIKKALGS